VARPTRLEPFSTEGSCRFPRPKPGHPAPCRCESGLHGTSRAGARFLLSGLQQRLLSSIPAFARTLRRHLATLQRHRDQAGRAEGSDAVAALLAQGAPHVEPPDSADDEAALLAVQSEEEEISPRRQPPLSSLRSFDEAIARVEAMLEIARGRLPDRYATWDSLPVNWQINVPP
jgi:hypothetical protein